MPTVTIFFAAHMMSNFMAMMWEIITFLTEHRETQGRAHTLCHRMVRSRLRGRSTPGEPNGLRQLDTWDLPYCLTWLRTFLMVSGTIPTLNPNGSLRCWTPKGVGSATNPTLNLWLAGIGLKVSNLLANGDWTTRLEFDFRMASVRSDKDDWGGLPDEYQWISTWLINCPDTIEGWKETEYVLCIRWNAQNAEGALDGKHVVIRYEQKGGCVFLQGLSVCGTDNPCRGKLPFILDRCGQ